MACISPVCSAAALRQINRRELSSPHHVVAPFLTPINVPRIVNTMVFMPGAEARLAKRAAKRPSGRGTGQAMNRPTVETSGANPRLPDERPRGDSRVEAGRRGFRSVWVSREVSA